MMVDAKLFLFLVGSLCFISWSSVSGADGDLIWSCNKFGKTNPIKAKQCDKWSGRQINWKNVTGALDPEGGSKYVLQINYPNGSIVSDKSNRGGISMKYPLPGATEKKYDAVTLQYELYFKEGFQFVKGGKLPGLFGGTGTCAGGKESDDCFSCRFMWRTDGEGQLYCYIPNHDFDETGMCDDDKVICNSNYGESIGRGYFTFTTGEWQCLNLYIKLNDIGQSNGELKVRFNGSEVVTLSHLNFRINDVVTISNLYFVSFFGGNKDDWRAIEDSVSYVRNIKIWEGDVKKRNC